MPSVVSRCTHRIAPDRCSYALKTLLLVASAVVASTTFAATDIVLDQFDDLSGWSASASQGARIEIARDAGRTGMAMRLDFDLEAGGYVMARKTFDVTLPKNYAFKFYLRGDAPPNNLEFKLIDRTDKNVWWHNQRGLNFPIEWREVSIKKPRISFAWGPAGGGALKHVAAIEIAIAAGKGGKGSVWIDGLRLVARDVDASADAPSTVSASTAIPDHGAERALDTDLETSWRSGTLAADQWLLIDFLKAREYGGLVIDWDPDDYATAYQLQVSDDGENWTAAYTTTTGNGRRDYIYMPDVESRYIRLQLQQSSRGQGYAIRSLTVKPFSFSASPNQFFEAIAADAPLGTYPKYFAGQQTYWTVIGANGDDRKAILNEEGMLEVEKGEFSIEPFLFADGKLITWHDARATQALAEGYLPIPSVTWQPEGLGLTITAFAAGQPGASTLYASYQVENKSDAARDVILFLAVRPFQVLPPWQSLNMIGGVTTIRDIVFDARTAWVNGEKAVISLTPPGRFGAATFEEGLVADFLLEGKVPLRLQVSDPQGYASGAFEYRLRLEPGHRADVYLAVPFHAADGAAANTLAEGAAAHVTAERERTAQYWRSLLDRVDIQVPGPGERVRRTLKTTLAYILINRDGPAIHPGARTYARSWIRDGALTSKALLELGFTEEVRDFLRWYTQYQFADGRVPCCVDARGPDPVPEHDSNGEFIYAIAEYYRFTRDVGFLSALWPAVVRAVGFLDGLRQLRMTDVYKRPDKQAFYGLLPESISHEGYSSHPVHSYWDDFFALRGIQDAANLAIAMDDTEHAGRYAALRDAFRADLYASIARTMATHKLDYIPASADLGDFDPTSTAIAISPGVELPHLPPQALKQTFDRYFTIVQDRQHAAAPGEAYTPYELRNVAVFVRLGERERANMLLEWLMADQRPPAWNQWQEIIWRDAAAPRFIGDMPHTWVGSGFIRSVRTMFAYEREEDRALVIAAGLPSAWVMTEPGVVVKRLPTYYGVLTYSLRSEAPNRLRLHLAGDLSVPAGKLVIRPPLPQPLRAVTVNGLPVDTFTADSAIISQFPADVVLEYGEATAQ